MKKIFSLIIMVFISISTLTNCSNPSTNDGEDTTSNVSDISDSTSSSSDEPITLKFVGKEVDPEDETTKKFFEETSKGMKLKGINVNFEIVSVQSGTYSEKLGLLLQSGEIPDIIYFQGGDYEFAMTQGILEDLSSYVNKSTAVQASMNEYNKERLSNYPYLLWLSPTITPVPVVRKDFFENTETGKTLLENPTADNYYEFLKEVKEKNDAEYAVTVAGDLNELNTIFDQSFGLGTTWVKGSDGKYIYGRVSEFEKEKLAYYAKLYEEGLLDNEYLTKLWDTKESAFYDGDAAIISGTQGKVIDLYNSKSIAQNGKDAELMVLPPAKGEAQGYNPIDISKESRGFAISKTCENKDAAFAVLEYFTTDDGQILDKLGFLGEHYVMEDGKMKLTDKFAEWYPRFWNSITDFKALDNIDPSTPYISKPGGESLSNVEEYGTKDNAFIIPEDLVTEWDACLSIYKEFTADVVTGKKSIDDFDEFVEEFNNAGGKQVTEYANTVLK